MSFLSDNFSTVSGTSDLSTDTLVNWTKGAGTFTYAGTLAGDGSGRICCSTLGSASHAWYVARGNVPPSADYQVQGTFTQVGSDAGSLGVMARSGDSSDGVTADGFGYAVQYVAFSGFKLLRLDSGTPTTLATLSSSTLSAGQSVTLTLKVQGSSVTGTVSGAVSGTQTVTDGTYSAAGYVGLLSSNVQSSSTGLHSTGITASTLLSTGGLFLRTDFSGLGCGGPFFANALGG